MILQELLKTCTDQDFKRIVKIWNDKTTKEQLKEFCEMLLTLTPNHSDDILIAIKYLEEGKAFVDANLYHKKEFMEKVAYITDKVIMPVGANANRKTIDEYLEVTQNLVPESYAYEFSEWEDILGAEVYEGNYFRFGRVNFLAAVFYELSFNGFTREEQNERRADLDKSIAEMEQITALPPEEQRKYMHTLDELEIEDERTPEEKKEERRLMMLNCAYYRWSVLNELRHFTD